MATRITIGTDRAGQPLTWQVSLAGTVPGNIPNLRAGDVVTIPDEGLAALQPALEAGILVETDDAPTRSLVLGDPFHGEDEPERTGPVGSLPGEPPPPEEIELPDEAEAA